MFKRDKDAAAWGVTPLDNVFIRDYLPAAKGDYVKVYLYALYISQGDEATIDDIAHDLDMEKAEIEAALRYWERRALVTRVSEQPPAYVLHSPLERSRNAKNAPLVADLEYVEFSESVYAVFGDRRKLRPAEIALAYEWVKELGLPQEAVLMLINHAITSCGVNFSFKRLDMTAARMKDDNVLSAEDADQFLRRDLQARDGARAVLRRMGKRRFPSEDELSLYVKWRDEWQFAPDAVLSACAEMTKGDPSFMYLDKILAGIRARGDAKTGAQVETQLSREEKEMTAAWKVVGALGLGGKTTREAALALYRSAKALYDDEVILIAAESCAARKQPKGDDVLDMLAGWREKGFDEARVKQYVDEFKRKNRALRELFELAGHSGLPTAADRALYDTWLSWGYDMPILRYAAEQSRGANGSKIGYLVKVVEAWHEAGITDVSQAKATRPAKKTEGKTVTAQRYEQREYSKEELTAAAEDMLEEVRKARG